MPQSSREVLLIRCTDRPGLIHSITGLLLEKGCNIVSNHEFVEPIDSVFFMRTEFFGTIPSEELKARLAGLLPEGAWIQIHTEKRQKVILFATKETHCLGDILLRHRSGELEIDIPVVISNHKELESLVTDFHLPFRYVGHEGITREEHEAMLLDILSKQEFDYIVLAKFMRILSKEFVSRFPEKIVNIHHSFLPAFIGANPYQKAYERGVKLIGATAHFVTESLDEGPILAQDVVSVDHSFTKDKLMLHGRDIEKVVLARALRFVLEHRGITWKNRVIIFR
ncbi:formyltetrahydrofolate deformylase [Leptospira kobayashii]|uniref:Formyltetrahydrofolate deformylase n=1 Tax=Leptospira kobayashii TaxID=1917830 RepID=A0ABM7UK09_9LEPT|nr:formyltetrahydrofolate deformylase [Leptospira kobayashii]BDA79219.1 formyltetrahydrofolate deformylase [Leptospira kobayashii]